MRNTTTLLLLRHAHTEANEHGATPRMAGWSDIPLSPFGEAQLEALRRVSFGTTAASVYASTSPRALRTAEAALRGGQRIVRSRSLREISCGAVDGWLTSEVAVRHPELWLRNLRQDDPDFRWPGGESYREFRARVLRALGGIAARHCGERVLVVTHAGAIAQAVGHIRGVTPAAWEPHRPSNCSLTTLEWRADGTARLIELAVRVTDVEPAPAARRHAG